MRLRAAVLFPGLWVLLLYRACHHLVYRSRLGPVARLAYVPLWFALRICGLFAGIDIDVHAHIGRGLLINHFGAIVIGPVIIGDHCNLSQSVTLGKSSRIPDWELADGVAGDAPVIGDRVWLGPGAVVAGPVVVAADASVAANSLVTRDVPERGIAMGVPAQVVSRKGSFTQVSYRGMENDAARVASLRALRAAQPSASVEGK